MFRLRLFAPVLLIAVALLPIGAHGAAAQQPDAIEFPSLTLTYRDRDGQGTAQIANLGTDPASEGSRIGVMLRQSGRTFRGQGFVRQSGTVSFVGAFWLTDDSGRGYFFTGTFVRGFAGWSGQGRYELIGNPSAGDAWTMASLPCIEC